MDPAACRVIYIDDRFNTERWISRDGLGTPKSPVRPGQADFGQLPADLQANVNAFLTVFNQVFVCNSGRSYSTKLSELREAAKSDCTPILACFDVGSESHYQDSYFRSKPARFSPGTDSPLPTSPQGLRREMTFSSESDESYGLQLLSRIAADLQVEEGAQLIIPVAIVQPKRKGSQGHAPEPTTSTAITRSPYGSETTPAKVEDTSDTIDTTLMLQCLEAGALDVVKSPLNKAGIMGLTVHAFRIYKTAKREQASFMAAARRGRKQSWVGMEEERPYAYLREAMVKKLLKGICEPETVIEDYQHRSLFIDEHRKDVIAHDIGRWDFSGHDFTEDELAYAGYIMLDHAVQLPELEKWRMSKGNFLRFMQACRVAYNSFVLYHNFRHAVDVLQSVFYFLCQIGTLPPYPPGSEPPPLSRLQSPIARLLKPFEALTLLISAIGHDVGHPGVNNMFLVKLNAPLAQLYNDQSVLEAFHCAAYSQILRRHWPSAFHDKTLRKLLIASILATDMGVHSDYMQQLGLLQEKIHESQVTDGWSPKDVEAYKVLTCGLLIKCADISNVARPWPVAEKWTHILQQEFAHQGEMEQAVGMETTLFGGPPELGNVLKLANGQIGFMTIFAHPLFANVADIIPAMDFAAKEILTNKGVWLTKAEHEKRRELLRRESGMDPGSVSPRTRSPVSPIRKPLRESPLSNPPESVTPTAGSRRGSAKDDKDKVTRGNSLSDSMAAVAGVALRDDEVNFRNSSQTTPRPSTAGKEKLPDKVQSEPFLNQERQASATQPTADDAAASARPIAGVDGVQDDRRDHGVSMRAGSDAVPVLAADEARQTSSISPPPLSAFTFATSDANEPVRTYDPQQHYPAVHVGARASAPLHIISGRASVPYTTQSTTSTSGSQDVAPLSPSLESTSYVSDRSEQVSLPRDSTEKPPEFARRTHRATSTPVHSSTSPRILASLSSLGSGKHDVHAAVMNGELDADKVHPRRKSRIRLAFWKKRSETEDHETEARS